MDIPRSLPDLWLNVTTWRVICAVTMDYAGINTSKICSQLCPWAKSCSTSWSRFFKASRAIVRTFCPMVTSPCANANLSVSDPEAGALWSNDCATQLKRKWRFPGRAAGYPNGSPTDPDECD